MMKKYEKVIGKAIKKAVKNGWVYPYLNDKISMKIIIVYYEVILFDISFARAFWGEEYVDDNRGFYELSWQYHIKQLALSEDRIEYIKKFL
jgi:hypothetical protein